MKYINAALALAALAAPLANADGRGTAAIVNQCSFPVYVWSVGDKESPMVALPDQTIGYKEEFYAKGDGSGISLKIAPEYIGEGGLDTSKPVSQFEYTVDTGASKIWYDLSYVNGNAFPDVPVVLQPSDQSCPNVTCAASDQACKNVYYNPHDDAATHACGLDADLFFFLCPGTEDEGGSTSKVATSEVATGGSSDTGPESVVVDANGNVSLQPVAAPAPAPAAAAGQSTSKAVSTTSLSSFTGFDSLTNVVENWVTAPGVNAKRDVDQRSVRHSHKEFHERVRRSRIFRHSHD